MKPKIILKRIFHRNEWRYAVIFEYEKKLIGLVKSLNGVRWSQTHGCWHVPDNEDSLKQILALLRDLAEIDISAIVSGRKEESTNSEAVTLTKDDEKPVLALTDRKSVV